jgi:subtilase family serine protease
MLKKTPAFIFVTSLSLMFFSPLIHSFNNLPAGCETPASISCVYGLVPQVPGCSVATTTAVPTGGWGTIALVETCTNSQVETNLSTFSTQFGLPECHTGDGCLKVIQSPNHPPLTGCNGAEYDMDVQWAHAMAPKARIMVIETNDTQTGLLDGFKYAGEQVSMAGGGAVSMSYSFPEFPTETEYDAYFLAPGVVYVNSAGDYAAGARYPGTSPNVIAAGGSTFIRDTQGNFVNEVPWFNPTIPPGQQSRGGSGGPSLYEPRPSYQDWVQKIVGNAKGSPDIAFFSGGPPGVTGVCIFASINNNPGEWRTNGGTSLSAPAIAGVINAANHRAHSTVEALTYIYGNAIKNYSYYWHDITTGTNG